MTIIVVQLFTSVACDVVHIGAVYSEVNKQISNRGRERGPTSASRPPARAPPAPPQGPTTLYGNAEEMSSPRYVSVNRLIVVNACTCI